MPWKKTEGGIPYFEEPLQIEVPLNSQGNIVSSSAPSQIVHMGRLSLEQTKALSSSSPAANDTTDARSSSNYRPGYSQDGKRLRARRIR